MAILSVVELSSSSVSWNRRTIGTPSHKMLKYALTPADYG